MKQLWSDEHEDKVRNLSSGLDVVHFYDQDVNEDGTFTEAVMGVVDYVCGPCQVSGHFDHRLEYAAEAELYFLNQHQDCYEAAMEVADEKFWGV